MNLKFSFIQKIIFINTISDSSSKQSEGIEYIYTSMKEVNDVTENITAVSEESAAVAQEMQAQAINLENNIKEVATIFGIDNLK